MGILPAKCSVYTLYSRLVNHWLVRANTSHFLRTLEAGFQNRASWSGATHAEQSAGHARASQPVAGRPSHPLRARFDIRLGQKRRVPSAFADAAQALCRFSARPVRAVPACSKVAHRIRPKAGLGQRFYCDYTDVFGALIFVQFNAYLLKSGTRK